jgi:hypothetical protein
MISPTVFGRAVAAAVRLAPELRGDAQLVYDALVRLSSALDDAPWVSPGAAAVRHKRQRALEALGVALIEEAGVDA